MFSKSTIWIRLVLAETSFPASTFSWLTSPSKLAFTVVPSDRRSSR